MLAKVLAASSDPCTNVVCGSRGTCFLGACTCDAASGYSGSTCAVPPTPVDGVWSEWVATGSCSAACGGGVQLFVRTCAAPQFGGAPCVGNSTKTQDCNTDACVGPAVDGGWSDWTTGTCSAQCPGDVGGMYAGTVTLTRTCTNPTPAGGAPCNGASSTTRMCDFCVCCCCCAY